ncbi:hypothetical protein EDC19_1723 [Natranaerovirga hydrolytica]|uniref:DUF308 domain-containing protein n=1 Tax=Natranaerovirga hydrolytica TaxID=680378 RepID=A0A4R1MMR2_9FIRM|nr:hypothetical protein [Natranaerovirga hydrolytica]TCK92574.1 hypothetical protein EDC19_1723 [Natranaerovirga hydrolytica]
MTVGYKRIFWGIFILTFRITIGIVTILPAFIGWIIVLTGLSQLEEKSTVGDFSPLKIGVMVLIVTSIVGGLLELSEVGSFLPMLFYPLAVIAIEFVVFHKIIEASVHNFNEMGCQERVEKYTSKDRTYIILMGITMVLVGIFFTFKHQSTGTIGSLMFLISRIYLLTVINALSKEDDDIDGQVKDTEGIIK